MEPIFGRPVVLVGTLTTLSSSVSRVVSVEMDSMKAPQPKTSVNCTRKSFRALKGSGASLIVSTRA